MKKNKQKIKAVDFKKYDTREDALNPRFIFSLTATQLLTEALKKEFDMEYLIRYELANRGVDADGKWIGFAEAKKLHRIE